MMSLLHRAAAIAGVGLAALAPAPSDGPPPDVRKLDDQVRAILAEHGDGVEAGLWVGGAKGDAWYAWKADEVRPTASAIKTAFLVELFARYAADLDRTPPGLDAILRDGHPAIAHFSAEGRDEVRKGLSGASVRRIGGIMMGSVPASNLVYNAAANVATALLGGPEGLTRAIHARDPAFAPIVVRRYMLADRKARGDNEATAASLAAVLRRVASGDLPGLRPDVVDAIQRRGPRRGLSRRRPPPLQDGRDRLRPPDEGPDRMGRDAARRDDRLHRDDLPTGAGRPPPGRGG